MGTSHRKRRDEYLQSVPKARSLLLHYLTLEGYEPSETEYPVLYMFHGIGGDYTSWLEYGNVARVMDKMIKEGKIQPFIMVIPDGYLSYYSDTYDGSSLYETFFTK